MTTAKPIGSPRACLHVLDQKELRLLLDLVAVAAVNQHLLSGLVTRAPLLFHPSEAAGIGMVGGRAACLRHQYLRIRRWKKLRLCKAVNDSFLGLAIRNSFLGLPSPNILCQ